MNRSFAKIAVVAIAAASLAACAATRTQKTAGEQIVRPDTGMPGFSRDSVSPASLMVSLGLFMEGIILSNSLPISWIRPGFSGVACGAG